MPGSEPPSKGDEYRHDDGTVEIVFATEDDRVLSVREYPDADAFRAAVADASYRGVDDRVAALPPAVAFGADRPDADGRSEED